MDTKGVRGGVLNWEIGIDIYTLLLLLLLLNLAAASVVSDSVRPQSTTAHQAPPSLGLLPIQ